VHEAVDDERERRDALRRRLRAERARLTPAEARAASAAVCAHLAQLPGLASARSLALYAAVQNEIDPAGVPLGPGVLVAYPRVDGLALRFHVVAGRDELRVAQHGIAEPPETAPLAESLDLIVVPGVAFDAAGNRLGFGRGYYDRALAARPAALRVGLAHSFQLLESLPRREGDEPVDWIVTPDGARATLARGLKEPQ
jgi:5-formyltetrahydrofolate cyclo-ligase